MLNEDSASAQRIAATQVASRKKESQDRLLRGPIMSTMLGLLIPSTVVMVVQIFVGLAETYFVSFLGTEALAAITLVFPVMTFMHLVSNGDFGGGVASSIARALGGGRATDANAIVLVALIIGVGFGLVFTVGENLWGATLYAALGGSGDALAGAIHYGHTVFGGAVLAWVVSLLAAALRGSGDVVAPAAITVGAAFVVIPLSPALIFGWGPFPSMGIRGAAFAVVTYYVVAAVGVLWYLRSGHGVLRLQLDPRVIERRHLRDVLRIGGISAVRTIQQCLVLLIITGNMGLFGESAIAGYGIASRLDYILAPLLFGLGTSVLTMVGVNIGGGQHARARRIALIGVLVAAVFTELLGLVFAIFPGTWLRLFSDNPSVVSDGAAYLQIAAPFYGFFGAGILVFSVGQAIGRLIWVFVAASMRLVIIILIAWISIRGQGDMRSAFIAVAVSYVAFGIINALTLLPAAWRSPEK